jgi:hypothetical protein
MAEGEKKNNGSLFWIPIVVGALVILPTFPTSRAVLAAIGFIGELLVWWEPALSSAF